MAAQPSDRREARLEEIRRSAAASAAPRIEGRGSYYNLPALKPPVWTWEVPLYFFIGGVAGVASCVALLGHLFHGDAAMFRLCLWIAFIGSAICPVLLIADLGRPSRFLNMLRVFKLQSPMSMGAWILAVFGGCVFLALLTEELTVFGYGSQFVTALQWIGEASAAITGLLLASYTGVLIGATAIPVWLTHRRFLPVHFLTSGLGSLSAILELSGYLVPATRSFGAIASAIECVLALMLGLRRSVVDEPLHRGRSGWAVRIAEVLTGPAALAFRFLVPAPAGRYAAALCFVVGACLSRYAWVWAGRASARQPDQQFALQRSGGAKA
jgi:hypothetical protein